MEEIVMIFKGVTLAQKAAAYFGLIDSVNSDVKKLLHQEFNAAILALNYASTSKNEKQQIEYLNDARTSFLKAIAVEKKENLISSYVGLALCQYLMQDQTNARISLSKIKNVDLSDFEASKAVYSTLGSAMIDAVSPQLYHGGKLLKKGFKRNVAGMVEECRAMVTIGEEYQKRLDDYAPDWARDFYEYKKKAMQLEKLI